MKREDGDETEAEMGEGEVSELSDGRTLKELKDKNRLFALILLWDSFYSQEAQGFDLSWDTKRSLDEADERDKKVR